MQLNQRFPKNCALKECRAEAGELFGLCQFKLNEDYSEKTLVDLTIAEDVLYEDLNRQLENSADEIRNREVKKAVDSIMRKGYAKTPDVSDIKEKFTRWAAYTYARLLSKQIFVPVETEDKELMYSPFQCMAQYFLSLGYHTNTINKDIHYFVCANNKVDYRGSCPGRHYVRADAIEQVVMMELRRILHHPRYSGLQIRLFRFYMPTPLPSPLPWCSRSHVHNHYGHFRKPEQEPQRSAHFRAEA